MPTIAIVPARGGSKRIPRKNIVDFCGKPLMVHALEIAKASGLFDEIHVSTEDDEIAAVATAHGFAPAFPRTRLLADDVTGLFPVLAWVLAEYARRGRTFDDVCLVMPTAPLIEPADLERGYALYRSAGRTFPVLAAARFPCPVEWAMRLSADGHLTAREPGMAAIRSQDLPHAYYDSGTFIWLPAAALMAGMPPDPTYLACELPRSKAIDIDEPEDLAFAEVVFRGLRARFA